MLPLSIDHLIVYSFLVLTLLIGFWAGRGITTVRDYAVADKSYSSIIIFMTLAASFIGGGAMIGDLVETYYGGIMFSAAMICYSLSFAVFSKFIAPKIDSRFDKNISMGDMVNYFYGKNIERVASIFICVASIGMTGAQMTVLAHFSMEFLGLDYASAVYVVCGMIVLYAAVGGIKSVTSTDVLQFIILIVVFPLITTTILNDAGGLNNVLRNTPEGYLSKISDIKFYDHLALMAFWIVPFHLFDNAVVQRFLMVRRNEKSLPKITMAFSGLKIMISLMGILILFSSLLVFDVQHPREIMHRIINETFDVGLRGFIITGVIAVIMSTIDSFINATGVMIAHNILPHSKSQKRNLVAVKVSSLLVGCLALFICLQRFDYIMIVVSMQTILASGVSIPLVAGIVGFRVDKKSFWACNIISTITFLILQNTVTEYSYLPLLVVILVGMISFFGTHYFVNGGKFVRNHDDCYKSLSEVEEKKKSFLDPIKTAWLKLFNSGLVNLCQQKFEQNTPNYFAFGVFFCFNFIIPFFMWTHNVLAHQSAMMVLRAIAGALCIGLMFREIWPRFLIKYFPVYWYITLLFCLPFLTTVMFIFENGSSEWLLNVALSITLLLSLVDWVSFVVLAIIGMILGFLFHITVIGEVMLNFSFQTLYLSIYVLLYFTLIGVIFIRRREMTVIEKSNTLRILGNAIAHEVRTPFAACKMNGEMLDTIMQNVTPLRTKGDGTQVVEINELDWDMLQRTPKYLQNLGKQGVKAVDMLITSVHANNLRLEKNYLKLKDCVEEAVADFGLTDEQRSQIHYKFDNDIVIQGDKEYMKNVFFNLIKNAFKHGGGNVQITISIKGNKVIFSDNGQGIPEERIAHIFESFYTTDKRGGTGLGLAFCKKVVEAMGGTIEAYSEPKKQTEFVLTFPQ
jgi:Na+/proline symporter/signal transduction histidine kinase